MYTVPRAGKPAALGHMTPPLEIANPCRNSSHSLTRTGASPQGSKCAQEERTQVNPFCSKEINHSFSSERDELDQRDKLEGGATARERLGSLAARRLGGAAAKRLRSSAARRLGNVAAGHTD